MPDDKEMHELEILIALNEMLPPQMQCDAVAWNCKIARVLSVVLALFGVAASTGKSGAQEWEQNMFFTGNYVHSWCQSADSLVLGYAAGVWDQSARARHGLNLQRGYSNQVDGVLSYEKELILGYCAPPSNVTVQQVTDIFCGFLRDNPAMRSDSAAGLFREAMKKAWPCKEL
jgi:Rap1a immunity proteins